MTNDSNPPTITAFLLSRIAEDERAVRDVIDRSHVSFIDGYRLAGQADRYDPARTLAECAAKRAIVGLHDYGWMGPDDAAGKGCEHDYEEWPCPTIRHLAAIYSDHPDYRQEWAA